MPQSLSQIWLHIVFSTKERRAYLQNEAVREEMFRLLSHEVKECGCIPIQSGGWVDHVHIVCGLSRTTRVCDLLEHVKSSTSKWIKDKGPGLSTFSWQKGYGAFSVSQSALKRVIEYVTNQPQHHRTLTYQEEFRQLCKKHGLEIDERYVWD